MGQQFSERANIPTHEALSEIQRLIINAPLAGEIIVGGVAGSGKTTAAVYRAAYLCQHTPRQTNRESVLLLCFNRALAKSIRAHLLHFPPAVHRAISVRTVHQWCAPFVRRQFPGFSTLSDARRRGQLVREAIAEARYLYGDEDIFEREPAYFLDEIRRIKGCGWREAEEYLEQPPAHPDALMEDDRRRIFAVAQIYNRLLREQQLLDFDDYADIALAALEASRSPARVRHVIIDEAQDLSAQQIELGRRLASESVLIIADQAQAIYHVAQRRETLPPLSEYHYSLSESFRTTAQIFARARLLLPEPLPDVLPARQGPAPECYAFPWSDQEAAFIADSVARFLAEGVPPEEIAVIARFNELCDLIRDALQRQQLAVVRDDESDADERGVHVITIHKAKGREFQVVIVAGLVESVLPCILPEMDRAAASQEVALARRQLYVAMTRSREHLLLTGSEGPPSRLLAEIGLSPALLEATP